MNVENMLGFHICLTFLGLCGAEAEVVEQKREWKRGPELLVGLEPVFAEGHQKVVFRVCCYETGVVQERDQVMEARWYNLVVEAMRIEEVVILCSGHAGIRCAMAAVAVAGSSSAFHLDWN